MPHLSEPAAVSHRVWCRAIGLRHVNGGRRRRLENLVKTRCQRCSIQFRASEILCTGVFEWYEGHLDLLVRVEGECTQEAEVGIAKVWASVLKEAKLVVGESDVGKLWRTPISIYTFRGSYKNVIVLAICSCNQMKAPRVSRISAVRLVKAYVTSAFVLVIGSQPERMDTHEHRVCI